MEANINYHRAEQRRPDESHRRRLLQHDFLSYL